MIEVGYTPSLRLVLMSSNHEKIESVHPSYTTCQSVSYATKRFQLALLEDVHQREKVRMYRMLCQDHKWDVGWL